MALYDLKSIDKLIQKYTQEFGGEITQIKEGVLGYGTILLHSAPGRKNIVVREVPLNEWSSGHSIRKYQKTPKKYQKFV